MIHYLSKLIVIMMLWLGVRSLCKNKSFVSTQDFLLIFRMALSRFQPEIIHQWLIFKLICNLGNSENHHFSLFKRNFLCLSNKSAIISTHIRFLVDSKLSISGEELNFFFLQQILIQKVINQTMDNNFSIPKEWYCPISFDLMTDPVIASDGFTYERASIIQWFKKSNHSPLTGIPLSNTSIIPNRALKNTIQQFQSKENQNLQIKILDQIIQQEDVHKNFQLPSVQISLTAFLQENEIYVKCELQGPKQPINKRNSASIICIIDISQSMDTDSVLNSKQAKTHGFSRLDLVKHSINTIIQFMDSSDEIAVIVFNSSAKIAIPLTKTTKKGKATIREIISSLKASGTTNIWDGFRVSLDILKSLSGSGRQKQQNTYILLLTDGEPNFNPPRGLTQTLLKSINISKIPRPNIHVFGYGYQLDSNLLNDISEIGYGTYTYIPDCSMVGTVFVNFIASALATIANDLTIQIIKNENSGIQILGFKQIGGKFMVGGIQYGQRRQVIIRMDSQKINYQNFSFNLRVKYGGEKRNQVKEFKLGEELMKSKNQNIVLTLTKIKYLSLLKSLAKQNKSNRLKCYQEINKFYEEVFHLSKQYPNEFFYSLLQQLKNDENQNQGQVAKAFEKQQWFVKWGRHYIPSLLTAHLMQTCTNFKDPVIQLYGGSLFQQFRQNLDTIFINIPPPKPSAKKVPTLIYQEVPVDMSEYYNEVGGCIYGACRVQMQDGTFKQISKLKKNDKVYGGTIKCIVTTNVFKQIQMVRLGQLLITPWHPIKYKGEWSFPSLINEGKKQYIYVDTYYNFVMQIGGPSIRCEGFQCIGLGHGINDNNVTKHEYFSYKILEDLQRCSGWNEGKIELKGLRRDTQTRKVNGLIIE